MWTEGDLVPQGKKETPRLAVILSKMILGYIAFIMVFLLFSKFGPDVSFMSVLVPIAIITLEVFFVAAVICFAWGFGLSVRGTTNLKIGLSKAFNNLVYIAVLLMLLLIVVLKSV